MPRLVVCADDMGMAKCINNGILESYLNGIVTTTSIMANGKAFEHAVEIIKEYKIPCGIHLVLEREYPLYKASEIKEILGPDGRFKKRWGIIKHLLIGDISTEVITKEWKLQIERCLDYGLKLDHLNGHGHIHAFPGLFSIVQKLAHENKIRYIRIPLESPTHWGRDFVPVKYLRKNVVNVFSIIGALSFNKKHHFISSDYFWGLYEVGNLNKKNLISLLKKIANRQGISELMCHPGCFDPLEMTEYQDFNISYHWTEEVDALTSKSVKEIVDKLGIIVIDSSGRRKSI